MCSSDNEEKVFRLSEKGSQNRRDAPPLILLFCSILNSFFFISTDESEETEKEIYA